MLICDGCNVRGSWEHRCHGDTPFVSGEPVEGKCECPDCHPSEAELEAFRKKIREESIPLSDWDPDRNLVLCGDCGGTGRIVVERTGNPGEVLASGECPCRRKQA